MTLGTSLQGRADCGRSHRGALLRKSLSRGDSGSSQSTLGTGLELGAVCRALGTKDGVGSVRVVLRPSCALEQLDHPEGWG